MAALKFARAAFLASVFGTFLVENGQAAELRVLAGGAMTAVWSELKPKFEQVWTQAQHLLRHNAEFDQGGHVGKFV